MIRNLKDREKTQIILQCLIDFYSSWGREKQYVIFPELRLGSGFCGVAQRRIDFFTIHSGRGNETTAFEIKVSRNDFKHDVNNDLKQRGARLYANKFIYVTPKGLLNKEEIPLWAGLWEIDVNSVYGTKSCNFTEVVPPPLHAKAEPSWGLICSVVRKINKEKLATDIVAKKDKEIAELKKQIERLQMDKFFSPKIQ